jgi:hypothetical protein
MVEPQYELRHLRGTSNHYLILEKDAVIVTEAVKWKLSVLP